MRVPLIGCFGPGVAFDGRGALGGPFVPVPRRRTVRTPFCRPTVFLIALRDGSAWLIRRGVLPGCLRVVLSALKDPTRAGRVLRRAMALFSSF